MIQIKDTSIVDEFINNKEKELYMSNKKYKCLVSDDILIYAFRYALGRRSYAPSNVIETIKTNICVLSNYDIKQLIKEINEAGDWGDDIDKKTWFDFRDYLIRQIS